MWGNSRCLMLHELPYRPWGGRGRGAGQGHDFLDGQAELEPVQGIADADLPLDFRVRQGWHDSTAFHIGSARSHVPGWHPHPQLEHREKEVNRIWKTFLPPNPHSLYKSVRWGAFLFILGGPLTSSHTTTVGPSHCAKGKPCLLASSSNSCLQLQKQSLVIMDATIPALHLFHYLLSNN